MEVTGGELEAKALQHKLAEEPPLHTPTLHSPDLQALSGAVLSFTLALRPGHEVSLDESWKTERALISGERVLERRGRGDKAHSPSVSLSSLAWCGLVHPVPTPGLCLQISVSREGEKSSTA